MNRIHSIAILLSICLPGIVVADDWQGTSALFLTDSNLQLHTASHGTSSTEPNGSYILLHHSDTGAEEIKLFDTTFIWQMTMRPDGKMLAVTDETGVAYITVKQAATMKPAVQTTALVSTMKGAGHVDLGNGCRGLAFSPNGKTLIVGDVKSNLYVFAVTDDSIGSPTKISGLFKLGAVASIAFKDDDNVFVASDFNNDMGHTGEPSIVQVTLSTQQSSAFTPNVTAVSSLAYSVGKQLLVVGGIDGKTYVYDAAGTEKWHKDPPVLGQINPAFVAMPSDDTTVVCGRSDSTIKVWDTDGNRESTTQGHPGGLNCLRYSKDNTKIVTTGSNDITASVQPAPTLSNP